MTALLFEENLEIVPGSFHCQSQAYGRVAPKAQLSKRRHGGAVGRPK